MSVATKPWNHDKGRCLALIGAFACTFHLIEAPEGLRFLTRSRVFTDEEADALEGTN